MTYHNNEEKNQDKSIPVSEPYEETSVYLNNTIAAKYAHILQKIRRLKIVLLIIFVVSNLMTLLIFFFVRQIRIKPSNVTAPSDRQHSNGNGLTIPLGLLGIVNGVIPTAAAIVMLR